jgi:hypothetical protein
MIERWLDTRAAKGINGRAPVFCTLAGKKLETAYVRALLPRLAAKARGQPFPLTPPCLTIPILGRCAKPCFFDLPPSTRVGCKRIWAALRLTSRQRTVQPALSL